MESLGAEVMLDGTCWAIVRPLGVRRRHMAVANGNLDEIAAGEGASTGVEPFIEAVDQSIITPALADLVRPRTDGPTWPVALAWLTRDQECRFGDVLEWRSPTSGSDSPMPASGREKGPRLEALRAFLMAITPEEQATRMHVDSLDNQHPTLHQEIGHRRWGIDRAQARLVSALGLADQTLPEIPLLIDVMRKAAGERVATATKLPAGGNAELAAAREEFEAAWSQWMRLDGERVRVETSIPIEERVLSEIQGELPSLSFTKVEAETQICPICEVPIDRAMAERCKLSHKLHDPDACRARWERRRQDFEEQGRKLDTLRRGRIQVLEQVALAKQNLEKFSTRVAAIEKARDSRESAWYSARRLQDDVERLADLINAQDAATKALRELATKLDAERSAESLSRQASSCVRPHEWKVRSDSSTPTRSRCEGSYRSLRCRHRAFSRRGDRTTAAIDSLKVLAFDLAALCLSTEGATHIPAFLLHDSPREADFGLSIYHQLFHLVRELEGQADQPLFQYIVTTMTRPSDDLTHEPWLSDYSALICEGADDPHQHRENSLEQSCSR
jgi:hypothetical protein